MTTTSTETSQTSAPTPTPSVPKSIPRVAGRPIIGSTIEFQKDQIGFVTGVHRKYGKVARARIVNIDWVFLSDPAIIHEINVRQWDKFNKPALAKFLWKDFLGNGLVPNDGEDWKRQHDLLKPGFYRDRIDKYGEAMVKLSERMVESYRAGERRDFRKDMIDLTLQVVGRTLFDADVGGDTDTVGKAMLDVGEMLVEHINMPLPIPKWWPSPGNRRKVRAIEAVEGVMQRLAAERRAEGRDHGDVLSHMIFAKYANGLGMNPKQLRDESMTLFFAGHETTAHAMTWAWYLLAKNPQVVGKMREELDTVLGDEPLSVAALDKLPYLHGVVKEAMRLVPSVWAYMREPIEDVVIGGYLFPKGVPIFISPYVLGRDESIHPDALTFEPARWTREYERNLPKGAYVPFAAGPRVCLGQTYAMMEMRLTLATFVRSFTPRLAPGFEPDFVPELSLNPGRRGLEIVAEPRA